LHQAKRQIIVTMQTIHTHHQIAQLKSEAAVLILFGGAHCGVCQAIKPQVEHLMGQRFPDITLAYVDCEQSPAICAQHQVFSLPAMKLYLGGQLCVEVARSFSLQEFMSHIDRPYQLWRAA
jgi:thioredoxin 1